MKKKLFMILFATILIGLATGGTTAYFTQEFKSNGSITAATFDVAVVNSDGVTIGGADIALNEKLKPGMDQVELYSFQINKNNTEVPMEYRVEVSPNGELFPDDGSSPINVILERHIDDRWVDVTSNPKFKPEYDEEKLRIMIEWPPSDHDIDFQSLVGSVSLNVIAIQTNEE